MVPRVFYLHQHIVNILTNSLGTRNRLLKAVLCDASCKTMQSFRIDKHVNGHLWRILELNVHTFDLLRYSWLQLFSVRLHDGRVHPIPDKPITKDAVWLALVAQLQEYDLVVDQYLTPCCEPIELLLNRIIGDHIHAVKAATRSQFLSGKLMQLVNEI